MKILITGALGQIGSKLIHSLKPKQFEEVRLIDNLASQRYTSLFNLPKGVNFKFYKEDICTTHLNKYFKDIDVVVHLAAITDPLISFKRRKAVERVNFFGTERTAKACIKSKSYLIFPSTTSVYGLRKGVAVEDCVAEELNPQSPYAASKLKAEERLRKLGEKHDLRFIIFRFGTVFGASPGMHFHSAVNKFVWQAALGKPLTIWRTAMNQVRPYLDVRDAVRAIFFVLEKSLFTNQIYNVVTLDTTVAAIIKTIRTSIPDLKINYVESETMNRLSYTTAKEKFKKAGFRYKGDLRKGIKEMVKMFSNLRAVSD